MPSLANCSQNERRGKALETFCASVDVVAWREQCSQGEEPSHTTACVASTALGCTSPNTRSPHSREMEGAVGIAMEGTERAEGMAFVENQALWILLPTEQCILL